MAHTQNTETKTQMWEREYERSLRGIFNCIDFWACQWAATDRN